MEVFVNESPVGVGKTQAEIQRMITCPDRYVYAAERVEALSEIDARIRLAAANANVLPLIYHVSSGVAGRSNVTRQLDDIACHASPDEHIIVLTTHEAVMLTDFADYEGWHIIIDEVPAMFALRTYHTPTDAAFFEANYTLDPIEGEWSLAKLTPEGRGLSHGDIRRCDGHQYLSAFHRRCSDPRLGPVVSLKDWRDMSDGREWTWWSVFSHEQLRPFATRTFLGSGFTQSISAKLFQRGSDVVYRVTNGLGSRPLVKRRARIVFYSERPTALSHMETAEGQSDLAKIGAYIASVTPMSSFFWSANQRLSPALMRTLGAERYMTPKQAGTSRLMANNHAAIFYAAKPSREVERVLKALDCTVEDWVATNEYETVLQFLTRTSVRDVASDRDTTLHVFNRAQANYLAEFFARQPHIECTVEKVDLPLSTQTRKKTGPKGSRLTAEEKAAREVRNRERHRLNMAARRAAAKGVVA